MILAIPGIPSNESVLMCLPSPDKRAINATHRRRQRQGMGGMKPKSRSARTRASPDDDDDDDAGSERGVGGLRVSSGFRAFDYTTL